MKLIKQIGIVITIIILSVTTMACEQGKDIVKLLEDIEGIRDKFGISAVGLALVKDGDIVYSGGLGHLSHESEQTVDKNTLFRLGSITKSFTGLTALKMEQDYPDLFTIGFYELSDKPAVAKSVILTNLLEHTAGITDLSKTEFDYQGEFTALEEAINIDPGTAVAKWPVAQHSSYSNAGYGYAGLMLEKKANEPYEKLVERYVLQPLQMNDSGFYPKPDGRPLAQGYDKDGTTTIPYWHMIYRSFGGLNSTPADMAKFLAAIVVDNSDNSDLNGSRFINQVERLRFENPSSTLAARSGLKYGYGLGSYHWFSEDVRFHGHGGDADGYLSHYGYNDESGTGYFVVINAFNHEALRKIRDRLEQYVIEHSDKETRQTVHQTAAYMKQWVGRYRPVTQRFGASSDSRTLEIVLKNNKLFSVYQDSQKELVPVTDSHYRRAWQPQATYAFIRQNNKTFLQGDIGNFEKIGARRR